MRAAKLIDGTAEDVIPLESALIELVQKAYAQPALLSPADLDPVRNVVGDGALDYALVITGFHFINRIADLLNVSPEALPESLRRFETLRRMGVRLGGFILSKMDLANRTYEASYKEALKNIASSFERATGKAPEDELINLKPRPNLIEAFQLMLDERDLRSSLDRDVIRTVHRTVEAALPQSIDEAEGFHPRPSDPVEAFAFIGTRYACRTTEDMIGALRKTGLDDLLIMDLAVAVADAAQWARVHRLLGLDSGLFYL